jgi:PDZ domain
MDQNHPHRQRVSRETRLLLTTALLAIAALWILARIRFSDRLATPGPIPPLLTQLASNPTYDDLAAEIGQVQSRLEPWLLAVGPSSPPSDSSSPPHALAAVRIRDDLAVTLLPSRSNREPWAVDAIVAQDRGSGLAVVRVTGETLVAPPASWSPRRARQPRYLIATDVLNRAISLRPVFIGALEPAGSPAWREPIWSAPARADLTPGSFLFTNDAELAGLVIESSGRMIVPGEALLAEVDHLLARQGQRAGEIGVRVQPMTPSIAAATGSSAGVVVTWVDGDGVAARKLSVGDVIEAIDSDKAPTLQRWDVRMARLRAGETLTLLVRRRGEIQEVQLIASDHQAAADSRSLGLSMRRVPGVGAQVIRVERGSIADRAGIETGDLITLIGEVHRPTPAQVSSAFASARGRLPVLVAVTRGDSHHVMTLTK